MKDYLKSVGNELKRYSQSLSKKAILTDKPWALLDDELELQKLIFKKDKELILSKNGQVEKGSWDYFPEANSLLIDRGQDQLLCNEVFINQGIMILKLDGTQDRFFALANENEVPDLNIEKYLEDLKKRKFGTDQEKPGQEDVNRRKNQNAITKTLRDGRKISVNKGNDPGPELALFHLGNRVSIQEEKPEDGIYNIADPPDYALEVKKGKLESLLRKVERTNLEGENLIIYQRNNNFTTVGALSKGDLLYINGEKPKNGEEILISRYTAAVCDDGEVIQVKNLFWRKLFGKREK